ncbi:hypothetical protein HGB07_02010 [Candidatus Roizmanbacteria bacterium]|nr:hypothetical protein [Candidatus Roizmanbacteria bacterium]
MMEEQLACFMSVNNWIKIGSMLQSSYRFEHIWFRTSPPIVQEQAFEGHDMLRVYSKNLDPRIDVSMVIDFGGGVFRIPFDELLIVIGDSQYIEKEAKEHYSTIFGERDMKIHSEFSERYNKGLARL